MNDPCSRVSREPLPEELFQLGKHVQMRKRVDLLGRNGAGLFYFLRTRFNSVRRQHQTPRAGPVEMTSVRRARLTVRTIDQQKINTVEDAAVARWTKSEYLSIDSSQQHQQQRLSVHWHSHRP
jgi:ABC-type branched-subunit amino acid transport system ATPase component